jgi:hypothetical protein
MTDDNQTDASDSVVELTEDTLKSSAVDVLFKHRGNSINLPNRQSKDITGEDCLKIAEWMGEVCTHRNVTFTRTIGQTILESDDACRVWPDYRKDKAALWRVMCRLHEVCGWSYECIFGLGPDQSKSVIFAALAEIRSDKR